MGKSSAQSRSRSRNSGTSSSRVEMKEVEVVEAEQLLLSLIKLRPYFQFNMLSESKVPLEHDKVYKPVPN